MKIILKKIKSVELSGIEECFDVKVLKNKNFLLAEPVNLLSHNSNFLGEQYLKGLCVFRDFPPPNYEECKIMSCKDCPKLYAKDDTQCNLFRAQYERKKAESFSALVQYCKQRISVLVTPTSPYNPFGIGQNNEVSVENHEEAFIEGEDVDSELSQPEEETVQMKTFTKRFGTNVLNDVPTHLEGNRLVDSEDKVRGNNILKRKSTVRDLLE